MDKKLEANVVEELMSSEPEIISSDKKRAQANRKILRMKKFTNK